MVRGLESGRRPALIVNECQVGVVDPAHSMFPALAEQVVARGIIPKIARLAQAFRARGLPVVHTPVAHRPDFADIVPNSLINSLSLKGRHLIAGAPETAYSPGLEPEAQDFVVERTAGLIAFNATKLDVTLRRLGVQTVVLTGVSTNVAMPGNTLTAVDLGYQVVLPEDCIAGSDPETHAVIFREQLRMLATVTTAEEVLAALG
jgi:nicotinamidase-related amidase